MFDRRALNDRSLLPTCCGGASFLWGSRTYIMGIINVTPDSFSGDGLGDDVAAAAAQARRFVAEGADILDIGGESTRPGHTPVSEEEELRRVVPAIEAVRTAVSVPISVDTYKSQVARAALDAGADLINDVWGLKRDPELARLAAQRGVPLVLMHNPAYRTCLSETYRPDRQQGARYADLLGDIIEGLRESCRVAQEAGVAQEQIIVDPGMGFGKNWEQNLALLRRLGELKSLGRPILLGTSRKATIGKVLGDLPPDQRVEGTAATVALGIAAGADMVRVHDVLAMARVARMADAIVRGVRALPV